MPSPVLGLPMRRPSRPPGRAAVAAVVTLCLAGAACSGGGKKKEAASTTTEPAPSTTTAPPADANADPLSGLPAPPGTAARPALIVKIDDAPKARPQAGINQAD